MATYNDIMTLNIYKMHSCICLSYGKYTFTLREWKWIKSELREWKWIKSENNMCSVHACSRNKHRK